jgi:RNA polymerase sigma-70 factor, ECF subfamily
MAVSQTQHESQLLDAALGGDNEAFARLVQPHRRDLLAHCYRMLGSLQDAEDALQDTLLRAWRGLAGFERRRPLRPWLYRIATNASLDVIGKRPKRVLPPDRGEARDWDAGPGRPVTARVWVEPLPDDLVGDGFAATDARYEQRESVELAFVAALQHLPPRQRAVLILSEVLRWKASEVAELLETSVAAVNSALQRARATLEASAVSSTDTAEPMDDAQRDLLARYVAAFEAYDMEALTSLIHEDASQSMPPYDLWLQGRDDIFSFWLGPGITCRDSRVIPTLSANGSPAFGQYRPSRTGDGYEPWALQVVEIADGRIVELTFFLATETLFPLFRLPLQFGG